MKSEISKEDLKVGCKIQFSTSGKYNPGFSTCNTYVGTVMKLYNDECMVKTEKRIAFIKYKHIEKIL